MLTKEQQLAIDKIENTITAWRDDSHYIGAEKDLVSYVCFLLNLVGKEQKAIDALREAHKKGWVKIPVCLCVDCLPCADAKHLKKTIEEVIE